MLTNPDGVRVTSSAGTAPATVESWCDPDVDTVRVESISAGDVFDFTCGSITVEVISGAVDVTFNANDGTTSIVSLNAGNSLTFDPATATLTADAGNATPVVVIYNGVEFTINPGATVTINIQLSSPLIPARPSRLIFNPRLTLVLMPLLTRVAFSPVLVPSPTRMQTPGQPRWTTATTPGCRT
jgi:hypothetical protein